MKGMNAQRKVLLTSPFAWKRYGSPAIPFPAPRKLKLLPWKRSPLISIRLVLPTRPVPLVSRVVLVGTMAREEGHGILQHQQHVQHQDHHHFRVNLDAGYLLLCEDEAMSIMLLLGNPFESLVFTKQNMLHSPRRFDIMNQL